jgi:2,5-diamino-6-(ribosylamino)-4(3H)-pyrimidinone 5'-phosphate reductase
MADNPGLNSRYAIFNDSSAVVGLHRQPRPFVLDPRGKWEPSPEQRIFRLAEQGLGRAPWWILSKGEAARMATYEENQKMLQTIGEFGGEVLEMEKDKDWEEILTSMASHGVRSVMIEGGGAIISSLLEKKNQRFVSSVIVTVAPTYLGQGGVVASPERSGDANEARLKDVSWVPMGQDVVMSGRLDLEATP